MTSDRARPRRQYKTAIFVLLIAVILGAGIWLGMGSLATSDVRISLDAQLFECVGDQATIYYDDSDFELDDGAPRLHALELREDMDCQLRFQIANDGWSAVGLENITLPMLGEGSMLAATASLSPIGGSAMRVAGPEDTDAVFAFEQHRLAPHSVESFVIPIVFSAHGCNAAGTVTSLHIPVADVSKWGLSRTVVPTSGELAFIGTADSDCGDSSAQS